MELDPVIAILLSGIFSLIVYRPLFRALSLKGVALGSLAEEPPPLVSAPSVKITPAASEKASQNVKTEYADLEDVGTVSHSAKVITSHYQEGEIQQPDALYITPEQVKTYDDRPWRPFRWPYHQTMSIFRLDINHWLDMDKYYWRYIQEKERIYHEYGKENVDWLPESYEACVELLEVVADHMLKRYPLLFTSDDGGVHVKNELTGELLDLSKPLKEHPLIYVSKMAKEDFYIVQKRDDDMHYLTAAAVPFPGGGFGIDKKLGKDLDVIHDGVPYYEEKLKKSMNRWFGKMTASEPVERASWYCTWDHELLSSVVYEKPRTEKIDGIEYEKFNVRVERQTLRRLPKSKAIIFTNHPVFYSIDEMKDEPLIPSLLKKIMYEAPEMIATRKYFPNMRDHLLPYLDGLIERQIELGLITKDTPLKTLPTYPFAHFVDQKDEIHGWNKAMMQKQDNARAEKEKEAMLAAKNTPHDGMVPGMIGEQAGLVAQPVA